MTTATHRWAVLLLLVFASPVVLAQSLGDEFIFFVDGTNILVPEVQAETVNDPLDATSGNKVAKFNAGGWTHSGFAWGRAEGVDATASVGAAYGESDTLYFRILSDPAHVGQNVNIWLTDKTNDPAGDRATLEAAYAADPASVDPEFRLIWPIPAWVHDGQWHDIAIPLPPATYDALEDAKANNVDIDTLAAKWQYSGAWMSGGFGIGPVGDVMPADDALWQEFEWNALYKMGPSWDYVPNTDASAGDVTGGPIYFDNVYIGGPSTSTSSATEAPTAMSGVTFAPDGITNDISWNAVNDASGYNVYASLQPISDVSAEGVIFLKRVRFDEDLSFAHRYELPHPSFGSSPVYYAVTTLSGFGVENADISNSAGSVANENLAVKPFIQRLTNDEADALFDDINTRKIATDASFPDDHPVFILDSNHRSPGDGTTVATLPEDNDNSGRFKFGYSSLNELYIYGEITDDVVAFGPEGETGGNTYQWDSAEFSFGHYDVRTVDGGGIFVGSPHQDMERGAEPDYGMRISGFQNAGGDVVSTSAWVGFSTDSDFGPASTIVEKTDTGWKFLSVYTLDAIQADGDNFLALPGDDEMQFIPFIIALNDADATGTRETQIVWSIKPTVTTQWWNTPAQWETVALAGRDAVYVSNEEEISLEDGFGLAQSAPNPAADQAAITFALGAPRTATLEVFNTLGQRVALVADGDFAAGEHTVTFDTSSLAAGVYVYRLSAGDFAATRRMTVVR